MGNIFIKLIKSNTSTTVDQPSQLVQLSATETTQINLQTEQSSKKRVCEKQKERKGKKEEK